MTTLTPAEAAEAMSAEAAGLDSDNLLALYEEIYPEEPLRPEPREDDFDLLEQATDRVQEYLAEVGRDPERIPDIWPSVFPLRQPVEYDPEEDRIVYGEVLPVGRQ